MKSAIKNQFYIFLLILFVISPLACNGTTKASLTTLTPEKIATSTKTIVVVEQASDTPTEDPKPSKTMINAVTQTPLPTFVMPPTPAPPSETWLLFRSEDTALSFQYPANWFVYSSDETYIYIANFRLDGLPLKGHGEEKAKINVLKSPIELLEYSSLKEYLDAPDQQPSEDEPGKIEHQVELTHDMEEYEMIRQTFSGLMGQADKTYDVIYVASDGKAIKIVVLAEQYINVAEKIASTLMIP